MAGTEVSYQVERYWVRDERLTDWQVGDPPVLAWGHCPSCGHETRSEIALTVVAAGMAGEGAGSDDRERITRVFECACGVNHLDSAIPPNGYSSCGRWWLASVRIAAGDGPPVRAAVDDTLLQAAQAVQAQTAAEESLLRSSAEKWTGAVTALFGLFGLSGLVFGKDALTGLPTCARVVVGGLALLAIVLAAGAVFNAYKSAYGWPTLVDVGDDQKLRDWYATKRTKLGNAASELRCGVLLALAALSALALAGAVTWFVPRTSAHPLITVRWPPTPKSAASCSTAPTTRWCASGGPPERSSPFRSTRSRPSRQRRPALRSGGNTSGEFLGRGGPLSQPAGAGLVARCRRAGRRRGAAGTRRPGISR